MIIIVATSANELIADGRAALRVGDAATARSSFEAALALGPNSAALEGLGFADYLAMDFDEAIDLWQQSYAGYRAEGNGAGAVRVARMLGYMYGIVVGDWAIGSGWIARAQHLLDLAVHSSEKGWIALTLGMFERDRSMKHRRFEEAIEVGTATQDDDLAFAALAYLGASLVHADRVEEGMVRLDESLAAVVGGEVNDLFVIEEIFCQMFSACERAHDVARAEQWLSVGEAVAAQRNLPAVVAYCHTHFGGVMTAAGRWPEADAALTDAIRLWALGRRTLKAGALARLADLRIRQGRLEEAEQLLDGLSLDEDCARPLATLLLEQGQVQRAREVLERTLGRMEPTSTSTVPLLALLVVVGCSDDLGKRPFVPAAGYSCVVTLSVPKEGIVGQWIPLKASLTNGPWVQVRQRDVAEGAVAWPTQPPAIEPEVAASLTWFTQPPGVARFNVATLSSAQNDQLGRQVVFSQPGVYKIWGVSAYPTMSTTTVETITIRAKP